MNYETVVARVAERAGVPRERSDGLTRAVLETLADRLTGGEALDLAAQLPGTLPHSMRPGPANEAGDRFSAAEFLNRVSLRAGVDERTAAAAVRAVFTTLREVMTGGEFEDLLIQLPRDYRDLTEPALAPGVTRRR